MIVHTVGMTDVIAPRACPMQSRLARHAPRATLAQQPFCAQFHGEAVGCTGGVCQRRCGVWFKHVVVVYVAHIKAWHTQKCVRHVPMWCAPTGWHVYAPTTLSGVCTYGTDVGGTDK